MWPFTRRRRTLAGSAFPLHGYRPGTRVENLPGLHELTPSEYSSHAREFKDEVRFHAPPIRFLDRDWRCRLGAVNGELYAIVLELELQMQKPGESGVAFGTHFHFQTELGEPSEQRTGFFAWEVRDGKVILQTVKCAVGIILNLSFISKGSRFYERL